MNGKKDRGRTSGPFVWAAEAAGGRLKACDSSGAWRLARARSTVAAIASPRGKLRRLVGLDFPDRGTVVACPPSSRLSAGPASLRAVPGFARFLERLGPAPRVRRRRAPNGTARAAAPRPASQHHRADRRSAMDHAHCSWVYWFSWFLICCSRFSITARSSSGSPSPPSGGV